MTMAFRCRLCGHLDIDGHDCLQACPDCSGVGRVTLKVHISGKFVNYGWRRCDTCHGSGRRVDDLYRATAEDAERDTMGGIQ